MRELEDEVNSLAQEKTERLMAGTPSNPKVKMEMLIIKRGSQRNYLLYGSE